MLGAFHLSSQIALPSAAYFFSRDLQRQHNPQLICRSEIVNSKFGPSAVRKRNNNNFLQQLQAISVLSPNVTSLDSGFFYLPEISSSSPLKLHRNYDVVKDTVDDWIISALGCSKSEMEIELVRQWNIPLAMCLCNPEGKVHKLIAATKLMVWMGLADDSLDECMSQGRQNVSAETICAVLDENVDPADVQGTCMKAEFYRLWQRLRSDIPRMQSQRFAQSMKECLKALGTVNYLHQEKISPSIDEYIRLRRLSGGVYPMFILQEYALGMEQENNSSLHQSYAPLLKQLEAAAADHIVWVNDLLSFRKEYFKGYIFNLPALLCICDECSLQEAVYKICKMIQAKEREFAGLKKVLMRMDVVKKKPDLIKYIDSLAYFMSGNLHWSFITARYHGLNNIPKYRHGFFELRADITVITPLCPSQVKQVHNGHHRKSVLGCRNVYIAGTKPVHVSK